jgi:formyltetrahydrofolate-dependent phosphoribosylglycinamide formyltransferase
MTPVAFFISGGGGNALNLLRACRDGRIPARPVLAVSSSSKAAGVERLAAEGLPVEVLLRSAFDSDALYSAACLGSAQAAGAEIVCLCGWLKKLVLPPGWQGRILNIHPALLPAFGGAGMYGMNVHRAVLESGVEVSGPTVHLVDDEYDHGRILAQLEVAVVPGETPEELQKRVYAAEMELYPKALAEVLRTRAEGQGTQPSIADGT